jgi:hypothetical protein
LSILSFLKVDMHSTSIIVSTAAFLAATTVLAAPASEKRSGQTIAVNQIANPKFKTTSGVLAAARAYSKFKKPFPKGLKSAVDKQFPGWGKFYSSGHNMCLQLKVYRIRSSSLWQH